MPVLDVELVTDVVPDAGLATRIAEAAAAVFSSPPGTVWVKLRRLDPTMYGENGGPPPRPVFVSVLKRNGPDSHAADEHARLAAALARVVGVPIEHVHITYEPAAAGRQSFGGRLVE